MILPATNWVRCYQGTSGEEDGGGSAISDLYATLEAGNVNGNELLATKLVEDGGRILPVPARHSRLALMGLLLANSPVGATIDVQIWGLDQAPQHKIDPAAPLAVAGVGSMKSLINLGFAWELGDGQTFTGIAKTIHVSFDNAGQVIPDRSLEDFNLRNYTNIVLIDLGSADAAGVFVPPKFILVTVSAISDGSASILAKTW